MTSIACGECTPDPSSPTTPSPSAASAGANINGQVVSSASSLTAAVVGTSLSASVAGDGRFALSRVPVNDVQIRFIGPGTNATLPLGNLRAGETLSIRVMVSGTTATLQGSSNNNDGDDGDDDDDDNDDDNDDDEDDEDEVEITGRVSGRSSVAGCPSITFNVGSRTVQTTAATFFRRVTCELLVDGQLVEVEGALVGGSLRAEKVQLEDAQGVERRGAVAGLSGSCASSLTFTIGGSGPVFFTNGTTEFKDLACNQIRNGLAVRADGHIQSNGQALAERVRPQVGVSEAHASPAIAVAAVSGWANAPPPARSPILRFSPDQRWVTSRAATPRARPRTTGS